MPLDSGAPMAQPHDTRLHRLNALLELARRDNAFQRARLGDEPLESLDALAGLPLSCKQDLLDDQARHPPFGTNLSFPLERYTRLHQTSGTTSATLRILDTPEDWIWWRRCMSVVLGAAGIGPGDRVALAYSFGPYIQFWASYEGVQELGAMSIALGGMESLQRLQTMRSYQANVLLCTPSYALHLARVATENDLREPLEAVKTIICTGEPGASVAAVRDRIESAWGARCYDHGGASEVGAFGYPCAAGGGVHLNEEEFVCELIDPTSTAPVADGELGELVVTSLGRSGFPVIRYRTGDIVRCATGPCPAGHAGRWLPDGIVGRVDDMVVIRGMNVFPSAIEQTLRESPGVGEFRITFYTDPRTMDEIKVEVEVEDPVHTREMQARLRQSLGLRVRIVPLKAGILPPHRGKARRVQDLRNFSQRAMSARPDAEAGASGSADLAGPLTASERDG